MIRKDRFAKGLNSDKLTDDERLLILNNLIDSMKGWEKHLGDNIVGTFESMRDSLVTQIAEKALLEEKDELFQI